MHCEKKDGGRWERKGQIVSETDGGGYSKGQQSGDGRACLSERKRTKREGDGPDIEPHSLWNLEKLRTPQCFKLYSAFSVLPDWLHVLLCLKKILNREAWC